MATVDLYLLTKDTIVRMTRELTFERVPVVGEFLRIDGGGLLSQIVTEVTHNADGSSRVVLGVSKNSEGSYDFWEDEDLKKDELELQRVGWVVSARRPNTIWKNKA